MLVFISASRRLKNFLTGKMFGCVLSGPVTGLADQKKNFPKTKTAGAAADESPVPARIPPDPADKNFSWNRRGLIHIPFGSPHTIRVG